MEDPSLIPGAVEEMLRSSLPVTYFRRTATRNTEARGVRPSFIDGIEEIPVRSTPESGRATQAA